MWCVCYTSTCLYVKVCLLYQSGPTRSYGHTYCPSACILLVDVSVGVNKQLSKATVTVLTGVEEGGHVVPGCGVCEGVHVCGVCEGVYVCGVVCWEGEG